VLGGHPGFEKPPDSDKMRGKVEMNFGH